MEIGLGTIPQKGNDRPSLKYLNRHVRHLVEKNWRDLGVYLLPEEDCKELDIIESHHQTDVNFCCTQMFQLWLRKQPTASWNQLIESLRQPGIQMDQLATKIEQMLVQPKSEATVQLATSQGEAVELPLLSYPSLNADFASLMLNVCHILDKSPNSQHNLQTCKDYCQLLRISDGSANQLFSFENIAQIKKCSKFKELFEIISRYMSWDEHSILTQLVNCCDSAESQEEIERFEKKLALFEGLQIVSSTSRQEELPKDFVKFCAIINKPYKSITIEEYNNIKTYIFSNLNVSSYVTAGFIRVLFH